MPDREKVISTLEEIKTQTAGIGLDSAVIAHGFIDKVIALLKEQEAVKPIKSKLSFTHGFNWDIWDCGCCGNQLRSFAKYCDQCGKAVKWE